MYFSRSYNFALETCCREGQSSSGKGHFREENVKLSWNLAKGTTAKAEGAPQQLLWIILRPALAITNFTQQAFYSQKCINERNSYEQFLKRTL